MTCSYAAGPPVQGAQGARTGCDALYRYKEHHDGSARHVRDKVVFHMNHLLGLTFITRTGSHKNHRHRHVIQIFGQDRRRSTSLQPPVQVPGWDRSVPDQELRLVLRRQPGHQDDRTPVMGRLVSSQSERDSELGLMVMVSRLMLIRAANRSPNRQRPDMTETPQSTPGTFRVPIHSSCCCTVLRLYSRMSREESLCAMLVCHPAASIYYDRKPLILRPPCCIEQQT